MPRFSSSVTTAAAVSGAPGRITSATPSSAGIGTSEKTSRSASPSVKKRIAGESRPERVIVTFVRSGCSPRAARRARAPSSRSSSAGLSRRSVSAPTRMASCAASSARTAAQSSGVEIIRRRGVLSSR